MTSREKFESWVKFHLDDKFTEVPLYRGNGGLNYLDSQVDLAWIAWQAAETELAVQLANAESKCRELAAENAGLKSAFDKPDAWLSWHSIPPTFYEPDRGGEYLQVHERSGEKNDDGSDSWAVYRKPEIENPSTDAFLAEVRAQGVEMYADNLDSGADDAERDGFDDAVKFLRSEASDVRLFAAQLRKGASE